MSKSTPQVPTPANPTTVANAQTTSNIGTAGAQAAENNINQVGPNGSTTYSQTGTYTDPTTGATLPTYTQTQTLDPLSQAILTGSKQAGASLVPTAQTLATQAGGSATTPLNVNQTANNGIIAAGPQAIDQNATNTIFQGENALLQPQFQQQQTDLQDQLSRAGISVGNPAYSNAETQLGTQQNQATTAALGTATGQGITSANNMFGMALQGQNQNLGQQQTLQSNPLSLLSQIYGGSPPAGATA
ncbi:hypothetical protein [Bradyrhizobium sp.]